MTNSDYTVIIPFFNEEKTLETAVTNLINENFASEIILVNDGSVDKSNEIALRLENKYEYIKLIGSVHNKGKGHALNLGINESSKEYIGILDADVYGPSLPKLINLNEKPKTEDGKAMVPVEKFNAQCMSMGFLVDEQTPMIWRGPMVISAIKTMTQKVLWKTEM